jgi:hypothetical protein
MRSTTVDEGDGESKKNPRIFGSMIMKRMKWKWNLKG